MPRNLGEYTPRRPYKLNGPLLTMLLNGVHDRHAGRVFVLQVGAGNGETGLPLLERFRDNGWSGLLIEPHPDRFAALEALHAASDRVAVLNFALSDQPGTLPLHSVRRETPGRQAAARRTCASFDPDRLIGPGIGAGDLQAHDVPVLRMEAVLSELGLDEVSLVAINAGGAEARVLQGFSLAGLHASLTLVHTPPDTEVERACVALMQSAGLSVFRIGDQLAGLAPAALSVPLDDLLTFLNRGVGQPEAPE